MLEMPEDARNYTQLLETARNCWKLIEIALEAFDCDLAHRGALS